MSTTYGLPQWANLDTIGCTSTCNIYDYAKFWTCMFAYYPDEEIILAQQQAYG